MYKRILIKISGEGISGEKEDHFHDKTIDRIVKEISVLLDKGIEIGIVLGGGNFWRGRDAKPEMDKVKAHQIGMIATIMNAIYMCEAFRLSNVASEKTKNRKAVVMSPFQVGAFTELFSKERALALMKDGGVPIFAGGTGHPFFSTDSIVAIRACELEVDAILYGKTVRCVYEEDPKKNKKAKKYKTLSYKTVKENQLEVADFSAMELTSKENIDSIVFALSKKGAIIDACLGMENIFKIGGTIVSNNVANEFYL